MNRTRRNWTDKEDALLRNSVQQELNNNRPLLWRELAKQIPGRSNKDCRKRWWNSLAGATAKGAWAPDEDRRLFEAVQKYGTNCWMKVAGAVGTRYGDQCSSHWLHVLNPSINYSDWTAEENQQLLEAVRTHGTNWSTISSFHTPERTPLALKNQYWKIWPRTQSANKTHAAKTSSPPLSAKTPAANNTLVASKPSQSASKIETRREAAAAPGMDVDEAEGDEDEDEDVDVQSDEGETHGAGIDIRASLPAEYAEADADPHAWLEDWTNLSSPQHTLMSVKGPAPLDSLWTDLGSSPTPGVPQTSSGSMAQISAAISANDEMYFSFMDDLKTFQGPGQADHSSTQGLMTPVSTSTAISTPAALQAAQTPGSKHAGGSSAHIGWPSEARSNLKSVSVKFSCSMEEVSSIMALVAGTGLNAVIKIDSEEVSVSS